MCTKYIRNCLKISDIFSGVRQNSYTRNWTVYKHEVNHRYRNEQGGTLIMRMYTHSVCPHLRLLISFTLNRWVSADRATPPELPNPPMFSSLGRRKCSPNHISTSQERATLPLLRARKAPKVPAKCPTEHLTCLNRSIHNPC
jgi:hypothetical protein